MDFEKLQPGCTVDGNEINAFKSTTNGPEYYYLIAGTHGDEPEGIYLLDMFFKQLKKDEKIDIPLIVIPVLNPDAVEMDTRSNSNNVDLNRNMPSTNWTADDNEEKYNPGAYPGSEPESKFLIELFEKYTPKSVLSFHTWEPFLNTNGVCKWQAEILVKYNNYEIKDQNIPGHETPGSLGYYVPEEYGAPVLTFECPEKSDEKSLDDIWNDNREGLTKLFEEFHKQTEYFAIGGSQSPQSTMSFNIY